jgi:membrane protease YdiL (CAAX protease family)
LLTSELDSYLVNKWLLVILVLGYVATAGLWREVGLVARANWRTLPLYWPMFLLGALAWLGAAGTPSIILVVKMLVFCLAVGITEEVLFRGLVFHWFRQFPIRHVVLISAAGFGLVHLLGFAAGLHPGVVLSQFYLAFSFGLIMGSARARDVSIMLPIAVHAGVDFLALSARGGVSELLDSGGQASISMLIPVLIAGTISMAWGLYLLWKLEDETLDDRSVHGGLHGGVAEGASG